jgi:hypothetical protein
VLNPRKVYSTRSATQTKNVLYDKDPGPEELNESKEIAIQVTPGVMFDPRTVIRAIHLASRRKPLAWRTPDYNVNGPGTDHFCQCFRRIPGQVAQQDVINALIMEIPPKRIERLCIRIYGSKALESPA